MKPGKYTPLYKKDTKQNQNSPRETTFSHKEMGKLRGLKLMDGKNRRNTKRERYNTNIETLWGFF